MDKVLHQKADVGRRIFAPIVEIMPELLLLILLPACKRINHEICVCPLPKGSFIQWLFFFFSGCITILYCNMSILWSAIKKPLQQCSRGGFSGRFFSGIKLQFVFWLRCTLDLEWLFLVAGCGWAWGTLHAIKNRWWWCYSTWYSMTVGKVQSHIWPLGYTSQMYVNLKITPKNITAPVKWALLLCMLNKKASISKNNIAILNNSTKSAYLMRHKIKTMEMAILTTSKGTS